jgi:hypothetical protein
MNETQQKLEELSALLVSLVDSINDPFVLGECAWCGGLRENGHCPHLCAWVEAEKAREWIAAQSFVWQAQAEGHK